MPVAHLLKRKEDIRVGRLVLTPPQQMALLDLLIQAKRAVADAQRTVAEVQTHDLFAPQPVRLPGDATG